MAALDRYAIKYLIVGGFAVGVYAEPRYTKDLDVLIHVNPDTIDRLYRAPKEFGAPLHFIRPEQFLEEDFVFFFGNPPWRIDLLTSVPGVDFEVAYRDRHEVKLGEITASCISKHWLIQAKLASGRPQDLADAAALQSAKKP